MCRLTRPCPCGGFVRKSHALEWLRVPCHACHRTDELSAHPRRHSPPVEDDDELTERVEDPLLEARQLNLSHHPGVQTVTLGPLRRLSGSSTDTTTRRALKDTSSVTGRQHQGKPSWRPASICSSFRVVGVGPVGRAAFPACRSLRPLYDRQDAIAELFNVSVPVSQRPAVRFRLPGYADRDIILIIKSLGREDVWRVLIVRQKQHEASS